MRAGIFQCAAGGWSTAQRLTALEQQLASESLDLLLCPELYASGYAVGSALITQAEPCAQGSFAQAVATLAQRYATAIVYGYPERDPVQPERLYNAAACFDATGQLIANHRKLILPPGFEADYFSPGEHTTLFTLGGLRCAILICYDAEYPEAVRAVAEAGAEVVLVPTALVDNWAVVARQVMPCRAFENGVWLLYANHAGKEGEAAYLGDSCIIRPDGTDAVRATQTQRLIVAELDQATVIAAQTRLPYLSGLQQLRGRLAINPQQ